MKKVFKGLSILVASTALCAGIATASACSGGYNGEYIGHYCYANQYNAVYGMVVKVSVENNIITKVEDITHSYGDGEGFSCTYNKFVVDWAAGGPQRDEHGEWKHTDEEITTYNKDWHVVSDAQGDWTEDARLNWPKKETWLLQQYEGKAVADVLDIKVYYNEVGEPYSKDDNSALLSSGLLVTNSTQGSGRVLLAVQNALKK